MPDGWSNHLSLTSYSRFIKRIQDAQDPASRQVESLLCYNLIVIDCHRYKIRANVNSQNLSLTCATWFVYAHVMVFKWVQTLDTTFTLESERNHAALEETFSFLSWHNLLKFESPEEVHSGGTNEAFSVLIGWQLSVQQLSVAWIAKSARNN